VCFKWFLLFAFPGWKSSCISHLSHMPYFCVTLLKICMEGLRIQSKLSEYQISDTRIKLKMSVIRHRSVNHSAPSFVSEWWQKGITVWSYWEHLDIRLFSIRPLTGFLMTGMYQSWGVLGKQSAPCQWGGTAAVVRVCVFLCVCMYVCRYVWIILFLERIQKPDTENWDRTVAAAEQCSREFHFRSWNTDVADNIAHWMQ
jgi:hypothetical protein